MSADGSVTLVWGDGEQTFRFAIGQFRELQEKVNLRRLAIGASPIGPMTLLKALQANDAWPDDIRDIIRIGLNGGGMKPADSHRLLTHHFDATGPLPHMKVAHTILLAGLVGSLQEPIGSKKKTSPEKPTSQSDSPISTAQVLQ